MEWVLLLLASLITYGAAEIKDPIANQTKVAVITWSRFHGCNPLMEAIEVHLDYDRFLRFYLFIAFLVWRTWFLFFGLLGLAWFFSFLFFGFFRGGFLFIEKSLLFFLEPRARGDVFLAMALGSGAMSNSMADVAAEARAIFLIGSNVTEQHPVFGSRLRQAVLRRGVHLVVADPRRIDITEFAELHLRQRPGTDVALVNDYPEVQKMLAHLPMLLHPAPHQGLVIGFVTKPPR